MPVEIDTQIQHKFLADNTGYLTNLVVSLCLVAFGAWAMMADLAETHSGRRLQGIGVIALPVGLLFAPVLFWLWAKCKKFALIVDRSGIQDHRITDDLIAWHNVDSIRFRRVSKMNPRLGYAEVDMKKSIPLHLRGKLTSLLLRRRAQDQMVHIETFGMKSGIAQLERVLLAFANLHPQIRIDTSDIKVDPSLPNLQA